MTESSVTSSPETIGGPLRDEAALERFFRSHFSALCEEAKGRLGEEAAPAAPKVVESTFRQAWEDREHIASEADLETYLHDMLHKCAARELSRRAGARHLAAGAKTTGAHRAANAAADVDQSWQHLTRLLHPEVVRAEAQAYTEQRRHHAAEHVGDLSKPRSWKVPVLLGIVAAAIAGGAMWYLTQLGADRATTRALNSSEARTLTAQPGQTARLTLDDSTRVMFGAGSKLTIPKEFNTQLRAVKIEGAGRFSVAPGNPLPFEIRAGNAAVIATGTTITARSYPNDPYTIVKVDSGTATVKVDTEQRPLSAGQALLIDSKGAMRTPNADELALGTGWTTRRIVMSGQLRDVVAELNRWLGTEIKVPELKALDTPAKVDAPMDSMRVAIGQVEQSTGLEFAYEGPNQVMVFRTKKPSADTKPPAAKPKAK
jgi:ferric-dicitrate binding protein FerR (iron transport regulator)